VSIDQAFDDPALVGRLREAIAGELDPVRTYTLMEVCGTHTHAIGRWGLRSLLPENLRLVSGPGCPVCVTPGSYIDNAAHLATGHGCTVATFGDLVRVPGATTSLEDATGRGGAVEVVYSPLDALKLARLTDREVVFLAIGFETTIAGTAAAIRSAAAEGLENLSFYTSFRRVPPALAALVTDPAQELDGFLLPGHASAILGTKPYGLLVEHGVPGVVTGFEPVDILAGILALVRDVNAGTPAIRNAYPRAVREEGNRQALALIDQMLEPEDAAWRGIGSIPASGYRLRDAHAHLDAARRFDLAEGEETMPKGCACAEVLQGRRRPPDCPLFGEACTPVHPVGPCMVSSEGSCAAWHRYRG
jgi:hydrogenase expression/formation protein HypD